MSVGKVVNKIIKNLPKIGPRNITYLRIKKIVRQIVSCTYIKLLQYLEVRLGCRTLLNDCAWYVDFHGRAG